MFHEKIKELRKEKGVTGEFVANAVGLSESAYRNYERGVREPNFETLSKLADFYDVTTDYLLGREDDLLDFLSLSDDDKNLEEKIGAMLLKFYRSVPAGNRRDFLNDARKLFETCKEEFYEQPRESTMVDCGTIGEELERRQQETEALRKDTA